MSESLTSRPTGTAVTGPRACAGCGQAYEEGLGSDTHCAACVRDDAGYARRVAAHRAGERRSAMQAKIWIAIIATLAIAIRLILRYVRHSAW
jgi:uncharacterized membrane protein YvbJ